MLVKETTTLHKVLSKYLSEETVHTIMSQVVQIIRDRLGSQYLELNPQSESAKAL